MFSCTKTEARRIAEGKAVGVTRRYEHGDCPHKVGNDIVFTGNFFRGYEGQQVPFARGKIVSVRPGTVGQFRNDEMLAYQDGFSTSPEWHGHINMIYRGISDDASVYHITFKLTELEKKLF